MITITQETIMDDLFNMDESLRQQEVEGKAIRKLCEGGRRNFRKI